MNLDTLRVFCDVVRCRSFSRGSALNRISQSAASQAVHQIEHQLGIQLIDRTKRPFILTPEGEVYYDGDGSGTPARAYGFVGEPGAPLRVVTLEYKRMVPNACPDSRARCRSMCV